MRRIRARLSPPLQGLRVVVRCMTSAAALLALGACAYSGASRQDAFGMMADDVFSAGYTNIAERYVEPVSVGDVAVLGMENVTKIDPELRVNRDGDHLILADGSRTVRQFATPRDDDPSSWAELTTAVLESGRQASPGLREADPERIYEVVFDGALSHLDRFSRYASAAVAREQRAQRDGFGGIGIIIDREAAKARVTSVIDDTPAAKIGIQQNDVIVAIEGQLIRDVPVDDIIDRLRGPVGSSVRLTIARGDKAQTREFIVRRALIVPQTVTYRARGDIAYIRLSSFNQRTTSSLERALRQAKRELGKELHGVVLDLRDNPGGLLDQAVTVSDLFLSHGRILSTSGRHPDSTQTFDAAGGDLLHGLPVAVLVNGGTASAAEVVAAALQDQGRAIVVGTSSYGKGTVQTVHRLPNDGEIIITWSRIHAPSGYLLNHTGVIPNVCTSKVDAESPEAASGVLDSVRSGRFETAGARSALHANPTPTKMEVRIFRGSCPPKNGDNKIDLEIAQRIVEDGSLFARAIQPSAAPEIAKRN